MVAAGIVLSGCGSGGERGGTTTSSPVAEASGSPWDLPLEQRPPLFDPCTELPESAVKEALGTPIVPEEDLKNQQPGRLMSCGWSNGEVLLSVLSTWKSKKEYLEDPVTVVRDSAEADGRPGLLLTDRSNQLDSTCRLLLFTSRGTVMISQTLTTGLMEYKGRQFVDGCDALTESTGPLIHSVPQGDFS